MLSPILQSTDFAEKQQAVSPSDNVWGAPSDSFSNTQASDSDMDVSVLAGPGRVLAQSKSTDSIIQGLSQYIYDPVE